MRSTLSHAISGCWFSEPDMDLSVLPGPALRALASMHRTGTRPLTAMDFLAATGLKNNQSAAKIREDLHLLGIIDAKIVREQGAAREYEIRLTPLGRALAEHAAAMDDILTKHKPKGGR